ncbi:hypothetical protein SPI_01563 [Niveomyces insectorum RCEF 264]|uniref:Uncharacterized protein n=1 Tax=Niveomyces insectorum RCEF 264 TaxID=1081102 RepID=A0A167Z297_9HYPO|nr:hypothetical protein SPI_01563 [Niveomyces insectorum RCEF 264]
MFSKRIRQYFICLVAIVVCIFYILTLVGCISTSPGLPGLFLVKIANNHTQADVRVGLFGICAGLGNNLTCASTFGQNLTGAGGHYVLPGTTMPAASALQPLLALAAGIQSNSAGPGGVVAVVFVPLLIGCIFFVTAVGALLAHEAFAGHQDGNTTYADGKAAAAFGHKQRAWQVVGLLTTYSVAAAVGAATAATVASRALLFAGTVLPGSTNTAASANASSTSMLVTSGVALPVLIWLIVFMTLSWHLLMTLVWRKI